MNDQNPDGSVTRDPIFIVGAPRSGTSLLRNLLNRHSRIALADETYFFYYVYNRRGSFGNLSDLSNRKRLVSRFLETTRIKTQGFDLPALRKTLEEGADSYEAFFDILLKTYASQQGKRRYGEKTPQHASESETLIRMFPDCKVIHLIRDPRDVVVSLKRMPWGDRSVVSNAKQWVACTRGALQIRRSQNYHQLHYEDLVTDPERSLGLICEFLGESFESGMLDPDSGQKAKAWWFERAQKAVSTERIEKWRDELSALEVGLIEWVTRPTMEKLGYESTGEIPGLLARFAALASYCFELSSKRILGIPRIWYHWFRPTQLAKEESWIDRPSDK